jgi:hypothetical protein
MDSWKPSRNDWLVCLMPVALANDWASVAPIAALMTSGVAF